MWATLGALFVSLLRVLAFYSILVVILIVINFPTGKDDEVVPVAVREQADSFYEAVYAEPAEGGDSVYVEFGQSAAHQTNIRPTLEQFIEQFELQDARTLEVGAGSGTLQDVVDDYTGLDIAANAARYFHKPFVRGSATDLPLKDSEFDVCWTIWTLEHVPNPERALKEMRRVVRSGGYLYLRPAWNNPTWAPHAYLYRPNSDLTKWEVLVKYSLYIREQPRFRALHRYPTRAIRLMTASLAGPSRLRYHKIEANFETFSMADSDAVNSIDCYEAELWFRSRGDEIVDIGSSDVGFTSSCGTLVVRLNKKDRPDREDAHIAPRVQSSGSQ